MRLSPLSQVRSAITGKNRFPVTIRQIQDQTISVIDPLTGKLRDTLPKQSGTLRGLVASGDGKQIAAIYNLPKRFDDASISVVLLWDLGTRSVRARFEQPGIAVLGGAFAGCRFLLVGGSGNKLSIWSLQ